MSELKQSDDPKVRQDGTRVREVRSPSILINAAKIMGLNPVPTGASEDEWHATCPSASHQLTIWSTLERWDCSHCGRNGSVDDLETLWRSRKLQVA